MLNPFTLSITLVFSFILVFLFTNVYNYNNLLFFRLGSETLYRLLILLFALWVSTESIQLGLFIALIYLSLVAIVPPFYDTDSASKKIN